MYKAYFGFTDKPFTIAPNPQYLFMSKRHQEALAHMLYGFQGEGGVMVLTGEVGTGKTTICRQLLNQIPKNTDVAYIINPKQSETEMLASLCDELHIQCSDSTSIKALTDALNQFLLDNHAQGRHTILIIDEAQNLDTSVLEQLRLLTNLETNDKKLLQIMLLGQPELSEILQRHDLRQLAQRITARYHLKPLNAAETAAYVQHRLHIAGCTKQNIFSPPVLNKLYQYSSGIPRLINLIADRALLGAYALESEKVSKNILKQAKTEVLGVKIEKKLSFTIFSYVLVFTALFATLWMWNATQAPQNTMIQPSSEVQATPQPKEKTSHVLAIETKLMVPTVVTSSIEQRPESQIPDLPTTAHKNAAFTPVFKAWSIDYHPETDGGDACTFAKSQGLMCLRQKGNIAAMRSLNRPAVLTVADESGQTAYTAVLNIGGTAAQTATQDAYAQVPLQQLALQSFNDFTLLWKTPADYTAPVRPGHQGALVAHLAEQVTQALNQSWIGAPRVKYDDTLKEQVKILQRQQGLNPDGVAGPITWIHINRLNHMDAPSLNKVNP